MTDFDLDYKRYQDALAIANKRTKELLFDALRDAGITRVTAEFDGEGDSGQIDNIIAFVGDQTTPLPETEIKVHSATFGSPKVSAHRQALTCAIENVCYGYLEHEHDGWENNEGAYGEFVFEVEERKISLDFNERFIDSTHYDHTF